MTEEEYEAQKRRLQANFEDARKALNNARTNLERIGNELRNLRIEWQEEQKGQP